MKTIQTIELANVVGAAGTAPTVQMPNAKFDEAYKRWSSSTLKDPGPAPYPRHIAF